VLPETLCFQLRVVTWYYAGRPLRANCFHVALCKFDVFQSQLVEYCHLLELSGSSTTLFCASCIDWCANVVIKLSSASAILFDASPIDEHANLVLERGLAAALLGCAGYIELRHASGDHHFQQDLEFGYC
jgi:hypothetical protein